MGYGAVAVRGPAGGCRADGDDLLSPKLGSSAISGCLHAFVSPPEASGRGMDWLCSLVFASSSSSGIRVELCSSEIVFSPYFTPPSQLLVSASVSS